MSLDKHAVYVRISEHQESPEGRFFNQGEGKVVIGNEVAYVSLEAGNIQFILLKKIFGRSWVGWWSMKKTGQETYLAHKMSGFDFFESWNDVSLIR